METLNTIVVKEDVLFASLNHRSIRTRISLSVDDLDLFVSPSEQDLVLIKSILAAFAATIGPKTNLEKCQVMHIRCSDDNRAVVQHIFPCQVA